MARYRGRHRAPSTTGRTLARTAVAGAVLTAPALAAPSASADTGSAWDRLAQCESGGNWGASTGNGYYGGIQFNATTWHAYGGSGMPHQASRSEQIAVAERTLAAQGWDAWPACSRKMGLRGNAASQRAAPGAKKLSVPASPKVHAAPQAKAGHSGGTYTVRRGDTLSRIAKAHGTTVAALYAANRGALSNPHVLKVGAGLHV